MAERLEHGYKVIIDHKTGKIRYYGITCKNNAKGFVDEMYREVDYKEALRLEKQTKSRLTKIRAKNEADRKNYKDLHKSK